jgi:hypothetical protein
LAVAAVAERHHDVSGLRRGAFATWVSAEFFSKGGQPGVAGGFGLAAQPGEQVGAPMGEVRDARRHAVRVQAQAEHVDRRLQESRGDIAGEQGDARVGLDELPPAVHHDGGVGLLGGQHALQGVLDRLELGLGQAVFSIAGGVAAGQQQDVAIVLGGGATPIRSPT